MSRVAAVLDEHQPKAFAFLHGGHYQGLPDEVKEFHLEMDKAAESFNAAEGPFVATVLRKQGDCDETTPYWKRVDGLLLSHRDGWKCQCTCCNTTLNNQGF